MTRTNEVKKSVLPNIRQTVLNLNSSITSLIIEFEKANPGLRVTNLLDMRRGVTGALVAASVDIRLEYENE